MTGPAASTVTVADWREWIRRDVEIVDAGIELSSTDARSKESPDGSAIGRFDAGTATVQWDRLELDRSAGPPGATVGVRYRVGEERRLGVTEAGVDVDDATATRLREAGVGTRWALATADLETLSATLSGHAASARRLRGDARNALADASREWNTAETDCPQEVRLSASTGRYLYVALDLHGDPSASPRVSAVDAYCPRSTAIEHLPECLQRSEGDFLERFLAIFERSFEAVDREIDATTALLDPHGVPVESLSWLESWLGIDPDPEWPESARRERLARAPELARRRGTRDGLRSTVELYLRHTQTGETEYVCVEPSDLDPIDVPTVREAWGPPTEARSFAVFAGPFDSDADRRAVERIVERESPAHTEGVLRPLTEGVELAGNTFLGVNSSLTERRVQLGGTELGEDAALTSRDQLARDNR